MKNNNIIFEYSVSLKILYTLVVLYFASIAIFSKFDNVVIGNIVFLVMAIYFVVHNFVYNIKIYYLNKELNFYLMFLIFATLSFFWSIEPDSTAEIVRRMFMVTVSLIIFYNILKQYNFSSAIFFGMLLITFINFFIFLGVIPPFYEIYFPSTNRFMGTTENPNILASIMFFSLFVTIVHLYKESNKIIIVLGYLNIMVGYYLILATVSRTALVVSLGLIFMFIINTLLDKKRRSYLLWVTLLVVGITSFMIDLTALMKSVNFALERIGFIFSSLTGNDIEHSAHERVELAMTAFYVFMDNPLFGTGMDTVRSYAGLYAHNNYAELLADSGLVGLILYYMIYISLAYKALLIKDKWIKSYLLMFVFSLFTYDLGGVSYYDKFTLSMIVFASYIAEISVNQKADLKSHP